jgi:hypothetical protein
MTRYAELSVETICDAIKTEFNTMIVAGDLVAIQNFDELTEGLNDENILQIYPESGGPVSGNSETQKFTLGTDPVIIEDMTIHLDYYTRQRSHLGEDMGQLVTGLDKIRAKIKEECTACSIFGIDVKNFQWEWNRFVITYAEADYVGVRFILKIKIF